MKETVKVAVHVTPRSGRDLVVGKSSHSEPLEVIMRVKAAPDEGKANKSVCELIAKSLGIPKSKVKLVRGQKSRHKLLEVEVSHERVAEWLNTLNETD